MSSRRKTRLRRLVLVLGDQLDARAGVLRDLDPDRDAIWMAEVEEEAAHVWCHKLRIAAFFSAMRHFRDALVERGLRVHYRKLPSDAGRDDARDFATLLARDLKRLQPEEVVVTKPGDWRVEASLRRTVEASGADLEIADDRHFLCEPARFDAWADGRAQLTMEHFYRMMRKETGVLVDPDGTPVGGEWNYDAANRKPFGRAGPEGLRAPRAFAPDEVTKGVLRLVARRFPDHPGRLDTFDLPVTRKQARAALRDFVAHRLAGFGTFQDAMWEGESFLNHSRLSFALNVKLLDPAECIEAAVAAFDAGQSPLNATEGFVRQILGWREFVRGVYWRFMPDYAEHNALECADVGVPRFFWDGETDMACVRDAMRSVLDHGYAHHIQRLMVLGLFAQLAGVHPRRFHEWHMAMYLDAIDWVSLPNTLGMSQYGDGGIVATKPYCASGAYVSRMSNHCRGCRYDPKRAVGEDACPFTSLYWDFLARHDDRFAGNHRMGFQRGNLQRKTAEDLRAIRDRAAVLHERLDLPQGRA